MIDTKIAVIGTAHDFSNLTEITLMHRSVVRDFFRKFEGDLFRTDTLLIVEGDPAGFNGKGDVFFTRESRNYHKRLASIFGSGLPYWINCCIAAADNRDEFFLRRFISMGYEIASIGAIKMNPAYKRPEIVTKATLHDIVRKMQDPDQELDLSDFESVDFKFIAEKIFMGSKAYLELMEEKVGKFAISGCNDALVYSATKWTGWFRKIIIIAGDLHSREVSNRMSVPYYDLVPEVMNNDLHFPSVEHGMAVSFLFMPKFYARVKEYCS